MALFKADGLALGHLETGAKESGEAGRGRAEFGEPGRAGNSPIGRGREFRLHPAAHVRAGGFVARDGDGGGRRVGPARAAADLFERFEQFLQGGYFCPSPKKV